MNLIRRTGLRPRGTVHILLLVLTTLLLAGCEREAPPPSASADKPAYVVAVNNPLYYFAQTLAGDAIDVRLPAPTGDDPAFWNPSVDELLELAAAELILLNSADYSPWVSKLAIADRRLITTTDEARLITLEDAVTHSHGPEGEHAHGGYAVTTWMDFDLAAEQASAAAAALESLLPDQSSAIREQLAVLRDDLRALDDGFERCAGTLKGRQLIFSHPVYQYFERRYALPGTSLHWEPDQMPGEDQWQNLAQLAADDALFIWEAAPAPDIAARMTAMGIDSVVLAPAAGRADDDWLASQRDNLARFRMLCP